MILPPPEELKKAIAEGKVCFVLGIGTSIATLGGPDPNNYVNWKGLLQSGIQAVVNQHLNPSPNWENVCQTLLNSSDLEDWLLLGDKIESALGGNTHGKYQKWIADTIGSLHLPFLKDENKELLKIIHHFDLPIATTNYDHLIEKVTGRKPLTWKQDYHVHKSIGQSEHCLHLHGHWEDATSIILGNNSYRELVNGPQKFNQVILQTLGTIGSLVFIGVKDGLLDPNFAKLREWMSDVLKRTGMIHYILLLDSEVGQFKADFDLKKELITPIGYGESYADLIPYLRALLPETVVVPSPTPAPEPLLPSGFEYLRIPAPNHAPPKRYRDYLQSHHLPYVTRAEFLAENPSYPQQQFHTEEEYAALLLDEGSPYTSCIIHGKGGLGKTRLTLELGQIALKKGWVVIRVKDTAMDLQPLISTLSKEKKYVLLFDYIEDSRLFNQTDIDNLAEEPGIRLLALANCRNTFLSHMRINVHDANCMPIDLDAAPEYTEYVIRRLIHLATEGDISDPTDYAQASPAFAVFLVYLKAQNRLQLGDIRNLGDFRGWAKKRLCATLGVRNWEDIEDEVISIFAQLPAKGEVARKIHSSDRIRVPLKKLIKDGWLDQETVDQTPILESLHDILADEVLIEFYSSRDVQAHRLRYSLRQAVNHGSIRSWVLTHERIADLCGFSSSDMETVFAELLHADSKAMDEVHFEFSRTALLTEQSRFRLLSEFQSALLPMLKARWFGGPLSFAIIQSQKIEAASPSRPLLIRMAKIWIDANPHFIHTKMGWRMAAACLKLDSNDPSFEENAKQFLYHYYAQKVGAGYVLRGLMEAGLDVDPIKEELSNYLRRYDTSPEAQFVLKAWLDAKGKPDLIQVHVANYLQAHDTSPEANFVLTAWLTAKGKPDFVQGHVANYLQAHDTSPEAPFALKAWLDAKGKPDFVKVHVANYLQAHDTSPKANFVLTAWLDAKGKPDFVQGHVANFLQAHDTSPEAQFVLKAWLDAKGKPDFVQVHVANYLQAHDTSPRAQFLLKAWLDAKGKPDFVQVHVFNYLQEYDTSPEAQFVLKAWLDAKGKPDFVQVHVANYLQAYDTNPEAQFVLKAWLDAKGKPDFVQVHVANYLQAHDTSPEARFALTAWLDVKGKPDFVQAHVANYLQAHDTNPEAQFVLKAWLDVKGKPDFVQAHVANYLQAHDTNPEAQFVLKAWLNATGKTDLVQVHVANYLQAHETSPEADFVLKAWLDAKGKPDLVQVHVANYLQAYDTSPEARFVLKAWLDTKGKPDFVQIHVANYLQAHDTNPEAGFALTAWLDAKGKPDFVQAHVANYLQAHDTSPEAGFALTAWLDAKGKPDFVQAHVANYLQAHDTSPEAPFVLKAWLDAKGKPDFVQVHVANYLQAHDASLEAPFVLKAWLDAKGKPDFVQVHIANYLQAHDTSPKAPFVLKAWLDAKGKPDFVQAHVANYLQNWGHSLESSFVWASWIRVQGSFLPWETQMNMFLQTFSHTPNANFVLQALIFTGHSREWLLPLVQKNIDTNLGKQATGYLIHEWLKAGGSKATVLLGIEALIPVFQYEIWMQELLDLYEKAPD